MGVNEITSSSAIDQIKELERLDIATINASKTFKILCNYFAMPDSDCVLYNTIPTEYEKLCERKGYKMSFGDMIDSLYEFLFSLKDIFILSIIDDSLDGDDMINSIWKLYYEELYCRILTYNSLK